MNNNDQNEIENEGAWDTWQKKRRKNGRVVMDGTPKKECSPRKKCRG
jgi:hypothetical protein